MLNDLLEKHCKNKDVLEIGCAGQSYKFRIYKIIKECKPTYLLGIDIQVDEIKRGRGQGFNVMVGDIEDDLLLIDIDREFDVVVMTEVIEHLNNPGKAISNIKKLMKPQGVLILTTPNCFTPKWIHQIQKDGKTKMNPDHVMWFDRQTLTSLFKRFGMSISFVNEIFKAQLIAIIRREE